MKEIFQSVAAVLPTIFSVGFGGLLIFAIYSIMLGVVHDNPEMERKSIVFGAICVCGLTLSFVGARFIPGAFLNN